MWVAESRNTRVGCALSGLDLDHVGRCRRATAAVPTQDTGASVVRNQISIRRASSFCRCRRCASRNRSGSMAGAARPAAGRLSSVAAAAGRRRTRAATPPSPRRRRGQTRRSRSAPGKAAADLVPHLGSVQHLDALADRPAGGAGRLVPPIAVRLLDEDLEVALERVGAAGALELAVGLHGLQRRAACPRRRSPCGPRPGGSRPSRRPGRRAATRNPPADPRGRPRTRGRGCVMDVDYSGPRGLPRLSRGQRDC